MPPKKSKVNGEKKSSPPEPKSGASASDPSTSSGAREGSDDSSSPLDDSARTDAETSGEPVADAEIPLEQVVAESRERLAEAELAPPVRKRGPYKKRQAKAPAEPEVLPPSAPLIPQRLLKKGIEVPFDLWAKRVQVAEVRLADDESTELAQQVDACLKHYLPQIPEQMSVLTVCIASFAMVTVSKAMIVAEARSQRDAEAQKREKVANDAWGKPEAPAPEPLTTETMRGFQPIAEH